MSRIFSRPDDEKPIIDKGSVLQFFEKRAEKASALGPIRTVIYQDKAPDLAERRDASEKSLLYPKIQLSAEDHVLDAGCGTGRWAELIIPACGSYHGVDVSPGLVEIAEQRYGDFQNVRFSVCSLDEITMEKIGATTPFSRIVVFGVYIYLNDNEVLKALRCIGEVSAPKARILVREPVATQSRLTLREHFSEDMEQYYNAVYRTESELLGLFHSVLGAVGFHVTGSGDVYSEADLNNRAETKQRWFLLER